MLGLGKRQCYAASAEPGIPQGHLGNLTAAQEARLRALWAIGLKFIEIHEADGAADGAETLEEKYVPPANKPKGTVPRGATRDKYPTLVRELLCLLPTDEKNLERLAEKAVEALDHWTPHMYRLIVTHVVKHEHPDALALRFLRASRWDLIEATRMMGRTVYWRTMEAAVDDDVMCKGEDGARGDEMNGRGLARTLGAGFMRQARCGKGFIHGTDREGRPITYIRVRLHSASDQCDLSVERYTVYLFELARLSLQHPVEMGTVLLDLSGFKLANFDLKPLRFLLKCMQEHYPESVGLIIIHNAPLGVKALSKLIRLWLHKDLASRIKFTRGRKGLERWIAPDQLIRELGGDEDWAYEYEEPRPDENAKMDKTATRDCLMEERRALALRFEEVTREWIMSAQGSERASEVAARRDRLVAELAGNYWELDPYVRARSVYDRHGCFRSTGGGVQWWCCCCRKLKLGIDEEDEEDEEVEEDEEEEKKEDSAVGSEKASCAHVTYESSVYESELE